MTSDAQRKKLEAKNKQRDNRFFKRLREFKDKLLKNCGFWFGIYDEKSILSDRQLTSTGNKIGKSRMNLLKLKDGLSFGDRLTYDAWIKLTLYESQFYVIKDFRHKLKEKIELCEKIGEQYQWLVSQYVDFGSQTEMSVDLQKKAAHYREELTSLKKADSEEELYSLKEESAGKILGILSKEVADHVELAKVYNELAESYGYTSDLRNEQAMIDYFHRAADSLNNAALSEKDIEKRKKYLLDAARAYNTLATMYKNSSLLDTSKEKIFFDKSVKLIEELRTTKMLEEARLLNDEALKIEKNDPERAKDFLKYCESIIDDIKRTGLKVTTMFKASKNINLKRAQKTPAKKDKMNNNGIREIFEAFKVCSVDYGSMCWGRPNVSYDLDVNRLINAIVQFYKKANLEAGNSKPGEVASKHYQIALARELSRMDQKELVAKYKMYKSEQCQTAIGLLEWAVQNSKEEIVRHKDNGLDLFEFYKSLFDMTSNMFLEIGQELLKRNETSNSFCKKIKADKSVGTDIDEIEERIKKFTSNSDGITDDDKTLKDMLNLLVKKAGESYDEDLVRRKDAEELEKQVFAQNVDEGPARPHEVEITHYGKEELPDASLAMLN